MALHTEVSYSLHQARLLTIDSRSKIPESRSSNPGPLGIQSSGPRSSGCR
ncbi:hypothetical protein COLO4_17024 [Corchorus olitorius]|uniref:Uncharacterized protein n=1 Tax=Corchorus olitorius TaxID=93759 RepID=A0A1R3JEJ3_9ROSI|nr:hypothetical protein COLO4_17024 [Corchorus olitorius]